MGDLKPRFREIAKRPQHQEQGIVSKVENLKEEIILKEGEIEKIKLEYGINDNDLKDEEHKSYLNEEMPDKEKNEII